MNVGHVVAPKRLAAMVLVKVGRVGTFFFCLVCRFYLLQGRRKESRKKEISNPELCETSQTKLFTCACRMSEIKEREFSVSVSLLSYAENS